MTTKRSGILNMNKLSLDDFNQIKCGKLTYSELMRKFESLPLETKMLTIQDLKNETFKISELLEEDYIDEELFKEFNNQLYLYVIKDNKKVTTKKKSYEFI